MRRWQERNLYTVFTVLLLLSLCGYCVSKIYGFVLVPDEFVYWAYAAKIEGYDWSDIVSMGSYYSYGYSLLLLPVFWIFKDGIAAYRAAVVINFILVIAAFFMLKSFAEKISYAEKNDNAVIFAAIAVMYPPMLFFAKMTMTETVLAVLYIAICKLMYEYLKDNKTSSLMLLILAAVYIYFVHMRAVGITIACIVILVLHLTVKKADLRGKKKQVLAIACVLAVSLIAGYLIKEIITHNMYSAADTEVFKYNDYSGQIEKLLYIFSPKGIIDFAVSLAGKLLYLGAASFGLAYWGIAYTVREIFKKNNDSCRRFTFAFVLIASASQILINAIYTIVPMRIDTIAYGRYHEFVTPVLMLIGLYGMWESRHMITAAAAIALSWLPMTALVTYSLNKNHPTEFLACMISGMSYALDWGEFEAENFYWKACIIGILLMMLFALSILAVRSKKNIKFLFTLVIAAEMFLTVTASRLCIDSSSLGAYRDTDIARRIQQQSDNNDRRVVYVDENGDALICILQFMLRDKDILIYKKGSEELNENDLVLLDYRSTYYKEELKNKYSKSVTHGHFILCYNIEGD